MWRPVLHRPLLFLSIGSVGVYGAVLFGGAEGQAALLLTIAGIFVVPVSVFILTALVPQRSLQRQHMDQGDAYE